MCTAPIHSDIAQQHSIERALRKSEERFRQVVDAAPNPMVMITLRSDSSW
ncbi:MAG TPA: hypothetical protein VK727_08760 [Steroidobacteraceae bacterium]|nr:hypothetical protein [Steroidobacteraceae bacterium]